MGVAVRFGPVWVYHGLSRCYGARCRSVRYDCRKSSTTLLLPSTPPPPLHPTHSNRRGVVSEGGREMWWRVRVEESWRVEGGCWRVVGVEGSGGW